MLSGYGLLLLACVLSLVLLARGRLPKLEGIAIALFIVVVACVGVGGLLWTSLTPGSHADGRALLACAFGPLVALLLRSLMVHRWSGPALGAVSTVLLIFGLAAHGVALSEVDGGTIVGRSTTTPGFVLVAIAVAVASVASALALSASWMRATKAGSRLMVLRGRGEAASAAFLSLSGAVAFTDMLAPQLGLGDAWASMMSISVATFMASRVAPLPITPRDATVLAASAIVVLLTVPFTSVGAAVAVAAAVVTGGLLAQSVRYARTPTPTPATTTAPLQDLSGLHSLAPILDDAILRRPSRPRVLSRTSTRRLLEAAIDKAWRAQPHARGRAPVDVIGSDEADIDGDASEIAEALCLVLDNAFRHSAVTAQRVGVTVRSVAQTVSIELDDPALRPPSASAGPTAPAPSSGPSSSSPTPFLDGSIDVDRPGYGAGLARARLLVERHGGQLSVRTLPQGTVHITLPRRVLRGPIGVA
jgi:hypothetical protein